MDIASDIMNAIAKQPREPARNYIGASIIGHECERAIYYSYHNAPSIDFAPRTKITFDVGKRLETLILDYLDLAQYTIIRPDGNNKNLFCFDVANGQFQGHLDGFLVIDGRNYVLEIKTANNARFQIFKNKGIRAFSETYYAQVQAYMGMTNTDRAIMVVMNKDNQEIESEWVDFDDAYYAKLRHRANRIVDASEPPPKINSSPLFHVCARCQFRETCFFGARPSLPKVQHLDDDIENLIA